ncbi:MAG TPA: ABC transporter permease [Patescibacteria group bacterium]|nr:ABC transporter permease [Patescibacteria group bacterium]
MIEFLGEVAAWFADPATWSGRDGIPVRLWEHLWISGVSLAAAIGVGLPLGLAIGHTGRGARAVVAIANIGRAVPSLGIMGLAFILLLPLGLGVGPLPTIIALTALGIPPIVVNAYVGLREVDRELVEAASGMGMRAGEILRRVEIPIALPVILAGVRTSAVQIVATATLAAAIGGGTLGQIIFIGFNVGDQVRIFGAALVVAALSIATEVGFGAIQRAATSPGLRGGPRPPTEAAQVQRSAGGINA